MPVLAVPTKAASIATEDAPAVVYLRCYLRMYGESLAGKPTDECHFRKTPKEFKP